MNLTLIFSLLLFAVAALCFARSLRKEDAP